MTVQHSTAMHDPWRAIQAGTDQHRAEHGCWAYPHADGRLLGVLAAATNAKRILELGTALGYTALWLAHGAPAANVDTLERDPQHVAAGTRCHRASRVWRSHPGASGRFRDLAADASARLRRRLLRWLCADAGGSGRVAPAAATGLLVSANQELAGPETADYRAQLQDPSQWLTAPLGEGSDTSLSIRLDVP